MEASLKSLLVDSKGYPRSDGWEPKSLSLRPIPDQTEDTVMGAVYWVKSPINTDWLENLECKPHQNSLAPGKPKTFSICYSNPSKPDWIGLPRFLGMSLFGRPRKDNRSFGTVIGPTLKSGRPLRDYQLIARENAVKTLQEWGGATLIADCGFGKTLCALAIAAELKRKTLVICNRSFLMQQWKYDIVGKGWTWADDNSECKNEDIKKLKIKCAICKKITISDTEIPCICGHTHIMPWASAIEPREGWLDNVSVGWLQGQKIDTDKDIVIASIESLSQCDYPREVLSSFGLVIVDEMHHLGAQTLSQVLPKLNARYILGISATPDRNDGLEHVLYWLAGPTCFVYRRLPSVTGISNSVEVQQRLFQGGNREEIVKYGRMMYASMVSCLSQDDVRNEFVIKNIKECVESGRKKILVVTTVVEHARKLLYDCDFVKERVLIYGGAKPVQIAQAKSTSIKLVISTYQFLEEGYDDAYIDTLIMALPRSNIQQVVGRIERTHDGKLTPLVLDFIDTFSVFEPMGWKRNKFYKSRGFRISRS